MTWKLVKIDETEKCEHDWDVKGAHGDAGNTYINYECYNCDTRKEIQLAMDSVVDQWYDFNEPIVNKCIHCDESRDDYCGCHKCPVCEKVTLETYEDGVCEHCICDYCHDNHGCEIFKCKHCKDEYACDKKKLKNDLGLCNYCHEDVQKTDKEKQEKADALKENAARLLKEAEELEKLI